MMIKPPGWPLLTAFSATALVTCWLASVHYYWYDVQMITLVMFVWIPLVGIWAIRYAMAAGSGWVGADARRWFTPWFIIGGVVLALVVDAPLWFRFTVSAPSMNAFVQTVDTEREEPCQRVGLYYACHSHTYSMLPGVDAPGSVAFGISDGFGAGGKGFLYLPHGVPEETAYDKYKHLIGPWYAAAQGWNHG